MALLVLATSIAVSVHWLISIAAIQIGQDGLQPELRYLPLAGVGPGRLLFGERPRAGQWVAIGVTTLAAGLLGAGA